MFLKLGIIGIVLIVCGIIFSSEILSNFPNTTSTGIDSLKSDANALVTAAKDTTSQRIEATVDNAEKEFTKFSHNAIQSAEKTLESSVNQTEIKLSEIKNDSSEYFEENIAEKIPFVDSQ